MDNYIMYEGRQIFLTDEQTDRLKNLEIIRESPFTRVNENDMFNYINSFGGITTGVEHANSADVRDLFDVANYCTDYDLMHQRALHETLNRLLWRFSMENGGDKIHLSDRNSKKWYIYYDPTEPSRFNTMYTFRAIHIGDIYFPTKEVADKALNEIVRPFIQAHPEYKI